MNEAYPLSLLEEIKANVERLKEDLEYLNHPTEDYEEFAEGFQFSAYQEFCRTDEFDAPDHEILDAFYRSLDVFQTGHPNLISAEPTDLDFAFTRLIESAIEFGESLLENSQR